MPIIRWSRATTKKRLPELSPSSRVRTPFRFVPHRPAHWAVWAVIGLILGGLLAGAGAGCAPTNDSAETPEAGPRYLTTIAPFRAILAPVVGQRGDVAVLLESGGSPHTYEPRPSDLKHASRSAALFYGAAHLDEWAADLPASNRIALMDLVPETERLYWDDGGRHAPSEKRAADPHFWTDPMAVRAVLPELADTLCHVDAAGCSIYRANADSFAARLVALDAELEVLMEPVRTVPVMLAQPFFRYFMHRYGPQLIAVIEPHPGKEATSRSLQTLIRTVRERKVQAIFTQERLPLRAARAVAEASGALLHTLDPIGGRPGRHTYTEMLQYNARVLSKALEPTDSGT